MHAEVALGPPCSFMVSMTTIQLMVIKLTHEAGHALYVVFDPSDMREGPDVTGWGVGVQCSPLSWLECYLVKFGLVVAVSPVWVMDPFGCPSLRELSLLPSDRGGMATSKEMIPEPFGLE